MKLRLLALLCAFFFCTGLVARAGEPAKPTKARYADVAVETKGLGEAGPVVRRRVGERADVVLRRSGVLPPRDAGDPVLSVTVDELVGDEPGYVFKVEILVDGTAKEAATPSECRLCTEGELVDAIEGRLEHAVTELPVASDEPPPPRVDPTKVDSPQHDDAVDRPPGPGMKIGGATLVAVGGAATITGAVLAALKPKPKSGDPLHLTDTHNPGYALIAVGASALVTGAVLLIVDARRRAKHKRAMAARPR
jgi:hypothetical protein